MLTVMFPMAKLLLIPSSEVISGLILIDLANALSDRETHAPHQMALCH